MAYIGNASGIEQDKNHSDFHHNRYSSVTINKMSAQKAQESRWNNKRDDDTDSEISDSEHFLAKGICQFLLFQL